MNLEQLMLRMQEVDRSMVDVANQYQQLAGHKNELTHWINELNKPVESNDSSENKDSDVIDTIASEDENPVI